MAAPIGAIVQGATGLAKDVAPWLLAARKGKVERATDARLEADQDRLAGGAGGLSPGERQSLLSEAVGQNEAAYRQAQADLARAAPGDAGASGTQLQQANALRAAEQQGRLQAASQVAGVDQQVGAQMRAELRADEAAQLQREQQRRAQLFGMAQQAQQTGYTNNFNAALGQTNAQGVANKDAMSTAMKAAMTGLGG